MALEKQRFLSNPSQPITILYPLALHLTCGRTGHRTFDPTSEQAHVRNLQVFPDVKNMYSDHSLLGSDAV